MKVARVAVALGLLAAACEAQPPEQVAADEAPLVADTLEIAPSLLRELLGESVRVEGDQIRADGMLIRLAFDPLIRKTGPVSVQLVQGQGYRLAGIVDGSPLWLLGLRDGDVLTGVDKQAIIGREHELRSGYEARPGRVELTYMRGSEAHTVVVRIASGSAWRSTNEPAAALPLPPSPTSTTRSPETMAQISDGLRCVEADLGRCELTREVFDNLFANPHLLMSQARIVPAVRDGETLGFKLYGIRPGSLPKLLGLKNGDMIASVNGLLLATSMDGTLSQLRDANELRVAIQRQDQPYELKIAIVDKLSGPPQAAPGGEANEGSKAPSSPDLRDPFAPR